MTDEYGYDSEATTLIKDNPFWDGTDAAHPAWWRGQDHAVRVMCQLINKLLDDPRNTGGIASEPWESTRQRLIAVGKHVKRCMAKEGKG